MQSIDSRVDLKLAGTYGSSIVIGQSVFSSQICTHMPVG
jgi:hypothetical protein